MSVLRIVSFREVPIPVVIEIIRRYAGERGYTELQARVVEYGERVSKCPPEAAERLFNKLVERGFLEITASQIASIVPETTEELRALLYFEKRGLEASELEEILELVKRECIERETGGL